MSTKSLSLTALPSKELTHWVDARGVSRDTLKEFHIAWTVHKGREWVVIPIPDAEGKTLFYKLKRPHDASPEQPKYIVYPKGSAAALYPIPYLHANLQHVFIVEGEPDALLLLSHGIETVCSTGGAGTFKEEWLSHFPKNIEATLCFDLDLAGRKGEEKVQRLLREQRPDIRFSHIRLPEDLGEGGDVTDFFRRCRETGADPLVAFQALRSPYETSQERKKGGGGNPSESMADKLLRLVTNGNCILFHDQFKETYARFRVDDHWEVWKTRSKQFKRWLGQLLWETEAAAATSETLSTVLNVLEARALFKGELITLENRIAWHEKAIWYDLGDKKCRAVRITSEGWEIIEEPPTLFRRFSHQEEQVVPVRGGSLQGLFLPFVNLADPTQRPLFLVYLVSCFLPGIPHPIPNLHGSQGAAKTTQARMLRRIVDPSKMEVLSFSSNAREFVQQLAHHYFAFFDNISDISDSISDLLCRAVTGEGVSKRELYTDDEDIIYTFRRCIGLNGINPAAKKPDLLDRSILLKLERIPEDKRREERVVLEEFNTVRPAILGAVFDALSAAMRLRESVQLARLPRMADFARWGCAIALALGYTQDEFLNVYYANIAEQHQEAIQDNPVAAAMKAFMDGRMEWEGSMSELHERLAEVAQSEKIDTHAKEWPKAANALSRRLNEAKTNLVEIGITFQSEKGTHGKRMVLILRAGESTADTATSPQNTEESDPFVDDTGGDAPALPIQTSLPVAPPSVSQIQAVEDDGGGSGDISSTPQTLREMGFFKKE
ncbi:hypothetical protein AUJ46_02280 [Candidatus Peregrinibacteria bacterium CG1_02_54_53]|nr:MAG: hypothetical protein AUJ46_02280 [Candidatus Peregrinibacteria bacterium CG1_02_54_53]